MKLSKSIYVAAAIAGGFLATACSSDGYWDAAEMKSVEAYSFNAASSSYVYGPDDAMPDIDVTVTRSNTSEAATLPVTAAFSDTTLLDGPESITFEAGQKQANYTIKVLKQFELGESAKATLTIDPKSIGLTAVKEPTAPEELEDSVLEKMTEEEQEVAKKAYALADSLYQDSLVDYNTYIKQLASYKLSTTVNFKKDYPYTSIGTGKMLDQFIYDDETYFNVEICRNDMVPNMYRIMAPYDEMLEEGGYKPGYYNQGPSEYMELTILPAGSEYADQTLTQEYVHFSDTRTGYYISNYDYNDGSSTDGEVWALFPACLSNSRDQSYWVNNIVAEYQDNGLPGEIVLAPRYYIFGVGGWSRVDVYGCISILFPGYVKADYSLGVTYAGVFTAPDGTVSAVADVEAGSDATDLRAIVWSQDDDASAIADAIAAGELEAESVEAGRIQVAFDPVELGSQLQLIVVAVAEGEAKNVATANFEYYTGADPWETLGTGYYTDDLVASVFGEEPPTYEVEIMYNSETGIYRLMNAYSNSVYPYADNDCAEEGSYIEVNAKNPNGVYIDKQELGFNWGYGDMAIQTWGARYLASYSVEELIGYGYLGKVENGTITFPIFTRTATDGSEAMYQGLLYMGTSGYYAGTNGKVEITLPDAPAYVKSRAKAKAEATQTRINKAHLQGEKVGKLPETQLPPRGIKGIRSLHIRDNPLPDPE